MFEGMKNGFQQNVYPYSFGAAPSLPPSLPPSLLPSFPPHSLSPSPAPQACYLKHMCIE